MSSAPLNLAPRWKRGFVEIDDNVRVDATDTDDEDDDDHFEKCTCSSKVAPNAKCCTDESCVNYATQVECVVCGKGCQNQRFAKKTYANVTVREAPGKGFGLFTEEALPARAFVYEYLGEIISSKELKKRLYDARHERHLFAMEVRGCGAPAYACRAPQ